MGAGVKMVIFKDLQELLDDHEPGMSQFQDDYFVTGKSGTTYAQYKQSLRELKGRFRAIKELICEKADLKLDLQELLTKRSTISFGSRFGTEYYRKKTIAEELESRLKTTKREFLRFYQQASSLKSRLGPLSDEKKQRLEEEMWVFKVKEMAAINYLCSSRLSSSTLEMLYAMPSYLRKDLLTEIKNAAKLVSWFENKEGESEFELITPFNNEEFDRVITKQLSGEQTGVLRLNLLESNDKRKREL